MLRFIESKAHTQKPSPEARPFYSPRMRKGRQVVKFKLTYTHAHSSSHGSKPMGTIRKLEDLSDYCEIFFVQSSRRQNTSWSIQMPRQSPRIAGVLTTKKEMMAGLPSVTGVQETNTPDESPDEILRSTKSKSFKNQFAWRPSALFSEVQNVHQHPKATIRENEFQKTWIIDLLHQMLVKIELTWTHVRV